RRLLFSPYATYPALHSFPTRRSSDLLGPVGRQGLVVVRPGRVRVERQLELVGPAEVETGLGEGVVPRLGAGVALGQVGGEAWDEDRKSTRLNSSHVAISYAVLCLKKK